MKTFVPFVVTALVAASPAAVRAADDATATFLGNCLKEGPRFSRTSDKAKREEWAPLASDMATAFTPVGDPTAIEGWLIGDGSSRPFQALVVFKAEVAGKRVEGCTTAYSGRDATVFEKVLATEIKAKALGEEQGEDAVYKRYSANIAAREIAITLTLPRYPKGDDQVVATAVAEEVIEN
jgi:hypothetical protein